ncbi:MAG: single-stranded DNA-binding protein [Myxococcota bacterium]
MRGMNTIFLVGRVGEPPDTSPYVDRARPLRVGTAREGRELDPEPGESTDWHEIRLVGQAAEIAANCVRCGSIVAVEGRLVYETREHPEGGWRRHTTVVASRLVVLGSRARSADPAHPWIAQRRA